MVPKTLPAGSKAIAVTAGADFAAAIYLLEDEETTCLVSWGSGWLGQLGNKTVIRLLPPCDDLAGGGRPVCRERPCRSPDVVHVYTGEETACMHFTWLSSTAFGPCL